METSEDEMELKDPPGLSLEDVSGIEDQKEAIRDAVVVPYREDRYSDFGASGIVIHGPVGVGKSRLSKAIVGELGFNYVRFASVEELSLAGRIREAHDKIFESQPCVILIENLGLAAPEDVFEGESVNNEGIAVLSDMLDEIDKGEEDVLFLGTTTDLSEVHEAVRRSGRIDMTVEIEKPDGERRVEIAKDELREFSNGDIDFAGMDWGKFRESTEGFSVADVVEVAERVARESFSDNGDVSIDQEVVAESVGDVKEDLRQRQDEEEEDELWTEEGEVAQLIGDDIDPPDVGYNDVGGLERAKRRLREAVEWPREHPETFDSLGIDSSRGILLHGPPGNGKTLLAKAVANETDSSFLSVKGPEIYDCYVGESEANIRELFEKAREESPAVIFIDEIDSIAGKRDYQTSVAVYSHVVNQLLSEIDGLEETKDVVVIGATNNIDSMDPAVLRPGRFDEKILVDEPDEEARREIARVHTEERKLADDVTVDWIVRNLEDGCSGAEIEAICDEAAKDAMRRSVENEESDAEITRENFNRAFAVIQKDKERDGERHDSTMFQ
jgi:SpoVK/Ycf46/Vps4 family AAA+-type ATPase